MRQRWSLGIARVHAEKVAREDRGLVAAGAGADFEEDVGVVARVLRDQQELQRAFELGEPRLERGDFLARKVGHFGVGRHVARGGERAHGRIVVGKGRRHRLQLREFLRQRAELRVVREHLAVRKQARDFFATFGERFQLSLNRRRHSDGASSARHSTRCRTGVRRRAAGRGRRATLPRAGWRWGRAATCW
jgi:hypothetical protein